jgi:hypothetical protein
MDGIESLLAGDERLLWRGEPRKGLLLRPSDGYLIPFSLLWCGFVVFWAWSAAKSGAPFSFFLFVVPFVAVGLYFVAGRFFVDALIREKTQYAVTNQRVIVASGLPHPQVKSLELRNLGEISLTISSGERATIAFGAPQPGTTLWPGNDRRPKFEMVERARTVHDLIRNAQQEALRSVSGQTSSPW